MFVQIFEVLWPGGFIMIAIVVLFVFVGVYEMDVNITVELV